MERIAVLRRKADDLLLFTGPLLTVQCVPSRLFSLVSKCREIGRFQYTHTRWIHANIQNKACLKSSVLHENETCLAISGVNINVNTVPVSSRWHSAFFQDQETTRILPLEVQAYLEIPPYLEVQA